MGLFGSKTPGCSRDLQVYPEGPLSDDQYRKYLSDAKAQFEKRFEENQCPRAARSDFAATGFLGFGTYGPVFLVRHLKDDVALAFKVKVKLLLSERGVNENVIQEKRLNYALQSKFIIRLFYAFHDSVNLYMVFERALYGDLNRVREWEEPMIRRTAAQIVLALEYLHACSVLHRDIRTDTVLIFEDFYVKLSGFAKAKIIPWYMLGVTYSFSGHKPYLSPQHYWRMPYGRDFDFWLLGSLIYELTYGKPPFYQREWTTDKIRNAVLNNDPPFPSNVLRSSPINKFIRALLENRKIFRLGSSEGGILAVKQHSWFTHADFNGIFNKSMKQELEVEAVRAEFHEIFGLPTEDTGPFEEF